jgi:hypothetical protein
MLILAVQEQAQWWQKAFEPPTWSNWALVGAAVWAGVMALKTLRAIEKQADLMKSQADEMRRQTAVAEKAAHAATVSAGAANASINTLREIERAWIIEEVRFPERIPPQFELQGRFICVGCVFKNIGRQPAIIKNVQTSFHTAAGPLPDKPAYSIATFIPDPLIGANGKLLAQNDTFVCSTPLREGSLDDDELKKLSMGGLDLYYYGIVRYETAGLSKFTQFCYKWHSCQIGISFEGDKDGLRRGGPDAYNQIT